MIEKRQSAYLLGTVSIIEEQHHLAACSQIGVMSCSIDAQERFTLGLSQ
jgi:hypothetical protein